MDAVGRNGKRRENLARTVVRARGVRETGRGCPRGSAARNARLEWPSHVPGKKIMGSGGVLAAVAADARGTGGKKCHRGADSLAQGVASGIRASGSIDPIGANGG